MKILAYDPSLINLGVAFGRSTPDKLAITTADTYKIDSLLSKQGINSDWGKDKNALRVKMVKQILRYTLYRLKPDAIVVEDPIFNKLNPDTLLTQGKGLGTIEAMILDYLDGRCSSVLTNYKPNVIKYAVGVERGDFKDKLAINRQLKQLMREGHLSYRHESLHPDNRDDHTNDAVAMVYTKHLEIHHELA